MAAVGYNRMEAAALLEEDIRCIVEVEVDSSYRDIVVVAAAADRILQDNRNLTYQ